MNFQPVCAVCGREIAPDMDHVVIEAETKRMQDRNDVDDFYFHPRCWRHISGSWEEPA